jgi:hypothetical protein
VQEEQRAERGEGHGQQHDAVFTADFVLRYRMIAMSSSVIGTTIFMRCSTRSRLSYWPLHCSVRPSGSATADATVSFARPT